jgi:hypothetical protein
MFEVYCNPKRHIIWNEKQIYIYTTTKKLGFGGVFILVVLEKQRVL